jgi:TRAP-type C4-dicarboxylate transport system permease small subunit
MIGGRIMEDMKRVEGSKDAASPANASGTVQENSGEIFQIAIRLQRITGFLAESAGHLAALVLLVLTLTIVLGIILREVRIDNYWTYDLDLFALAWLSFIGAVLTSLRNHHVTAGIALENFLGGRGKVLGCIRFTIIAVFLVMFAISGYRLAFSSFITHETTLDIVQWPIWVAKVALPLGGAAWLIAETHKVLDRFIQRSSRAE